MTFSSLSSAVPAVIEARGSEADAPSTPSVFIYLAPSVPSTAHVHHANPTPYLEAWT